MGCVISLALQAFVTTWEMLDPFGTGYIDATHVTSLLLAIEPPMGIKGLDAPGMRVQEIVQNVMIPLRWGWYGALSSMLPGVICTGEVFCTGEVLRPGRIQHYLGSVRAHTIP